jgi:hypothetical protein
MIHVVPGGPDRLKAADYQFVAAPDPAGNVTDRLACPGLDDRDPAPMR